MRFFQRNVFITFAVEKQNESGNPINLALTLHGTKFEKDFQSTVYTELLLLLKFLSKFK